MTRNEKEALTYVINVLEKLIAWDWELGEQNQRELLIELRDATKLLREKDVNSK